MSTQTGNGHGLPARHCSHILAKTSLRRTIANIRCVAGVTPEYRASDRDTLLAFALEIERALPTLEEDWKNACRAENAIMAADNLRERLDRELDRENILMQALHGLAQPCTRADYTVGKLDSVVREIAQKALDDFANAKVADPKDSAH